MCVGLKFWLGRFEVLARKMGFHHRREWEKNALDGHGMSIIRDYHVLILIKIPDMSDYSS